MSAPAGPQAGGSLPAPRPRAPRQRRHPHERYRRASAVIDDRPDGQPIIFGYGRHLTKREKDHVRRLMAYAVLETVVAACLAILVVTAVNSAWIRPNNTLATVTSDGVTGRVNRQDVDIMTKYYTYVQQQQSQSGQTNLSSQNPGSQAVSQLQHSVLALDEAKRQFGITASSGDIDAAYQKLVSGAGAQANLNSALSAAGISTGDYKRLFVAPNVVNQKVGEYLTRKAPTTAEQWHYARIQAASKKAASSLLVQIGSNKNPHAEFTTLAKAKSTDTQTAPQGGDLGWLRSSDTALDTLLTPTLISTLKGMERSHTSIKLYNTGSSWYVLELLGHDLKHKLSSTQVQTDQTAAVNAWGNPLLAKALFNPPLPTGSAGLSTGQ